MLSFLNSLNQSPPSLQVATKPKHLKIHQNHLIQLRDKLNKLSLKSSHNQSPFTSKHQQIQTQPFEPINQATIQSNPTSEQNQLKKIKKYSKILQNSNHLHKIQMYHTSSPSNHQLQILAQQQLPQNFIPKKSLTFQIQNVYNHYALKNQRKNRVLAKAKELGKNNFYRFLKESSLIGSNQHINRLYFPSKNLEKLNDSPQKTRQMSSNQKTLMVVSLEPNKNEVSIERKKKNLGLPKLLQRQTIKQKITLKTQMFVDPNLCLTTEGSSLSLKKSKSTKKKLIRNLTEINQKIRKNRNFHPKKETLLFPTQNLSMRNQEKFLSKWKYKSLFDTEENTTVVRKTVNEKKNLGTRMKTFTGHEDNRIENNLSAMMIKGEEGFQSKMKFLRISRSKLLKKEIPELTLSRNLSSSTLKIQVQQC